MYRCFIGESPSRASPAFTESETAATETLALPIYPEITDDQIHHVVESVTAFYRDR